jgi:hypothetical protein
MKKSLYILPLVMMLSMISCNNDKNKASAEEVTAANEADSLWKEVMDGHNIGMDEMPKLEKAQASVKSILDSIGKLPAAAQSAAALVRSKLDSLQKDLSYANTAMEKWMGEMNWSAQDMELKERIPYLRSENIKVQALKKTIFNSLAKADSLLKTKF